MIEGRFGDVDELFFEIRLVVDIPSGVLTLG